MSPNTAVYHRVFSAVLRVGGWREDGWGEVEWGDTGLQEGGAVVFVLRVIARARVRASVCACFRTRMYSVSRHGLLTCNWTANASPSRLAKQTRVVIDQSAYIPKEQTIEHALFLRYTSNRFHTSP